MFFSGSAVAIAIVVWAIVVALVDGIYRKIPNLWLLLMLVPAVLAVIINGHGLLGVDTVRSATGFVVVGLMLLPGYVLGQMGAGDVKLGAVLGLLSGFPQALSWLLYAALALGVMALTILALRRLVGLSWEKFPAAIAMVAGFLGYLQWGGVRLGVG